MARIKSNQVGVTFVDVILLTILMFITIFVFYAWEDRLAGVFLTFATLSWGLYITSASTGVMGTVLNLKKPTWLLGALISIPIWILIAIIPSSSGAAIEFATENVLVQYFGVDFFNYITQVFIVGILETIVLIGIFLGIFIRARNPGVDRDRRALRKERGINALALLILVSGVAAGMHYYIASQLASAEVTFGFILIHQFISFYIFALMFFLFGLPAAISSHMVKNLLVFGTPELLIFTFVFFLAMDILAFRTQPSSTPRIVKQTLGI